MITEDGKISARDRLKIVTVIATEIRDGLRTGSIDEQRAVQLAIWILFASDSEPVLVRMYRNVLQRFLNLFETYKPTTFPTDSPPPSKEAPDESP